MWLLLASGNAEKCRFWFFLIKFIFKREREWGRGRERERERERESERAPNRLHTGSSEPDVGLELMNHEILTWAETKSRPPNWLSHSGAPETQVFYWTHCMLDKIEILLGRKKGRWYCLGSCPWLPHTQFPMALVTKRSPLLKMCPHDRMFSVEFQGFCTSLQV